MNAPKASKKPQKQSKLVFVLLSPRKKQVLGTPDIPRGSRFDSQIGPTTSPMKNNYILYVCDQRMFRMEFVPKSMEA